MKKKVLAVLLAGTLSCSMMLGGCGKKQETEDTEASISVETEESTTDSDSDYLAPGVELPEEADAMISVMKALMAVTYDDQDGEYLEEEDAVLDREYYWKALQYLISMDGLSAPDVETDNETGTFTIGASAVEKYAVALFGNYDVVTQGLPIIPSGCDFVTYSQSDDIYTFDIMNTDSFYPYITICDEGDDAGTYKLQADLKQTSDKEAVVSCGFTMKESTYTGSGNTDYHYEIISCVNLNADDQDVEEDDADAEDAEDIDDTDETDAEETDTSSDTPSSTDAAPSSSSNSTDSTNATSSNAGISQSKAQGLAKSYIDGQATDDGSSYSMTYSGTKAFDGIDYYSFQVNKKDADGNTSYFTNIYVDKATGNDVWDEAE
jgi:hypothetical protein